MFSVQSILRRLMPLALLSSFVAGTATAQKIYAWGDGTNGRLTIPDAAESGVSAIAAGASFSLAMVNGGVIAWGFGGATALVPPIEAQSGVSAIAAGTDHALALKDGGVIAWGSDIAGETVVPLEAMSGVTDVSAAAYCSLALKNGGVIGWGSNIYRVMNIPDAARSGVTKIASSLAQALALKDGGLIGWGFFANTSLIVPEGAKSGVVSMACGDAHALALKADGSVIAWGSNRYGQCDVPDAARSGVVAVAAGYRCSFALKEDGSIVAWGDNSLGLLNIPAGATPAISLSVSDRCAMTLKPEAWVTLDQTEVYAGDAATGTVHLASPTSFLGTLVSLTCDNPAVHVPAYAIVPAGETEATFPVWTDSNAGESTAKIQTYLNNTPTVPFKLKIKASSVTLTPNHTSVVGGSMGVMNFVVKVGTSSPTPTTFTLTSSKPGILSVPASVTIPANRDSLIVTVTHNPVLDGTTTVTLTATSDAGTAKTDIVVKPFAATVRLGSAVLNAGDFTNATVNLNATPRNDLTLSTAGSGSGISMPATVTVSGGQDTASFPVSTSTSTAAGNYPVKVVIGGTEFSTSLRVLGMADVSGILLPSSVLTGNTKVVATVKLNRAAGSGGQVVVLRATDGLTVPHTVTVPAGMTSATFDVTPWDVAATTSAQITANGGANQSVKPVSIRPLLPASLTPHATSASSGMSITVTVALQTTPTVDTVVEIASNNPLVTVPATVTILAGTNSVDFTATVGTVTRSKPVQITATKNGKRLAANIVVTP